VIFMAIKKKKAAKTTKSTASNKTAKSLPKTAQPKEEVYSYRELADLFGISKLKARAYFNMCGLDYNKKITIKQARELFKKF